MKVLAFVLVLAISLQQVLCQLKPCSDRKPGWYEFDGSCYNFVDEKQARTWDEAQNFCENVDSTLLSIESKEESQFLLEAFEDVDLIKDPVLWIGLRSDGIGSAYKWSDGSALNFVNWRDGKPVSDGRTSCVMIVDTGKWITTDCDDPQHSFICKRKKNSLIPTTEPPEVDGNCKEFWTKFEKKCYRFYSSDVIDGGGKSYDEAVTVCKKFNATLASVHSSDEQDFITVNVGAFTTGTNIWLGGKRPSAWGGIFLWQDGSKFDYTNWGPGEPSNNRNEPCIEMFHLNKLAGKWNDVNCNSKKLGFVCKMPSDDKLPPQKPTSNCPYDYVRYRNGCFKVETEVLNFTNAEKKCQARNRHLATIGDHFDEAFLNLLRAKDTTENVWIGLSDNDKTQNGLFGWTDGWPVYFTKWDADQPQPDTKFNRCVAMKNNRRWTVTDCSSKFAYICRKRDSTDLKPDQPVMIGSCPESTRTKWIDVGTDHCYHVEYNKTGDFAEAVKMCGLLGSRAQLASFHSEHDLNLMRSIITDTDTNLYIGLLKDENGGYVWYDGSPTDFVPWDNGEPSKNYNEACVEVVGHKLKYNNIPCSSKKGYVCEVDKIPGPTVAPTTPIPTDCGPFFENWKYFNGTCYVFKFSYSDERSWHDASNYCNKIGAHLVSIHSSEENAFIYSEIDSTWSYNSYWIGLSTTNNEAFEWTDETVVNYDAVQATSEELLLRDEKCAVVSKHNVDSRSWNLEFCSKKTSFICKREYGTKPSTITPKPTTAAPGFCPDGWYRTGNKCIKLFGKEEKDRANFSAASLLCKDKGEKGNLLSITEEKHQALATALLLKTKIEPYIGLFERAYGYEFSWTDNSGFLYQNWGASEPSISVRGDVCGVLQVGRHSPGKWKITSCSAEKPYLCQIAPSTTAVTTLPTASDCWTTESGFLKYGNSCFKLYDEEKNWLDAEKTCQTAGGHLASISSGFEQNFINMALVSFNDTVNGLWMGLEDGTTKRFSWIDLWPVYYTNWGASQPQQSNSTRCAVLDTNTKEWNTTHCSDEMGFICKTTNEKPPVTPKEPNAVCPTHAKEWLDLGTDYCYFVESTNDYTRQKDWGEATMACVQKNADLASFHSQHDLDLLSSHLNGKAAEWWIGLLRKHNGEFNWHDNTPVDFEAWDENEPNKNDFYKCGALLPSNKWKSFSCINRKGYICKIKKVPKNETEIIPEPEPLTSEEPKGLSGGGKAGIVIFVIFGVIFILGVVVYVKRRSGGPNSGGKGVSLDVLFKAKP